MTIYELDKDWRVCGTNDRIVLPCRSAGYELGVYTRMPVTKGNAFVDVDGTEADIYVGGKFAASAYGTRTLVDVSDYLSRNADLTLICPENKNVNRAVKLHAADSDVFVMPYGIHVVTKEISDGGAVLEVTAEVRNLGKKRRLALVFDVLNARGRRKCGRKKVLTFAEGDKTVTAVVRMPRAIPYAPGSPYKYTMSVSVATVDEDEERILDNSSTSFGVVRYDGFSVSDKLVGCVSPHSNGVLGDLSIPEAEMRKLSAYRDLGYCAVRYIGCPSDSALDVADELCMRVIVDLFDGWSWPRKGSDHRSFAYDRLTVVSNAVRSLRNHPSVVMYSIGNAPEESYGRSGYDIEREIVSAVRALDDTRPVTAALGELTPLPVELRSRGVESSRIRECAGDEGLVSLGREVDLFRVATEKFVRDFDLYAYNGYSVNYPHTDKPVMGMATAVDDYYDAITEMSRNLSVIGDLSDCGMDHTSAYGTLTVGDVDSTCLPRNAGLYRSVLTGNPTAFITTGDNALYGESRWDFEEFDKVTVNVITAGDVVALYLNKKLIGRRLAGRLNKYIASFTVEYAPGKLEAVCFSKGRELCRATLETLGRPKTIKLLSGTKSMKFDEKKLIYIDAWILDKQKRIVTGITPDLEFTVEGGEIVGLGDAYGSSGMADFCTATDGHALCIVRPTSPGKLIVRATGNKLRRGQLTVTVKEQ